MKDDVRQFVGQKILYGGGVRARHRQIDGALRGNGKSTCLGGIPRLCAGKEVAPRVINIDIHAPAQGEAQRIRDGMPEIRLGQRQNPRGETGGATVGMDDDQAVG